MDYKLLIDGALIDGAATLNVINPASGELLAMAPRANEEQLNRAIAAAKAAFPVWSAMATSERAAKLNLIADRMEARFEEFTRLLTSEQGKPLAQAGYEIGGSIACLRYFSTLDTPEEVIRETPTEKIIRHRKALGVVAAITPWNFPMLLLMIKVAPALITGNCVVCKPAPTTPLTTLLFGEVVAEILPPGVLSTIIDQNDLGGVLSKHADVAKVSFTGSTATGKKVMESVASTLKRLTLELGGNDAAIVLDDISARDAAERVFASATLNAGQICFATKRVYAPAAMYDEFCAELAKLANAAVVDDGLKQGTQIGPIQNKQQFDKLLEYLADAHASGNVIAGGHVLDRPGYFIAPTIVRDISNDAKLVREEQFGPILPVLPYDSINDAIAYANQSEYGLGGTIWTTNPERGIAVAKLIDAGNVWVNKHLDIPFDVAISGAKTSGFGTEYGQEGMEEYTQAHIVNAAL